MRQLTGKQEQVFNLIALTWSVYLLYSAMYPLHPIPQAATCSGFALILCFALFPMSKNRSGKIFYSIVDWLCIAASVVSCGYMAVRYEFFLLNPLGAGSFDISLGTILLFLVLEATRRAMGPIIPLMVIVFLIYTYFGGYLPGAWGHPNFSHVRVIEYLYTGTRGYWGTITRIMSLVIPVFIIFGALLLTTGGGQTLTDLANQVAGRFVGGGAKMALIASAFFGMISGSSVSNVATTGAFTIPMMKSLGYKKEMAAAVEAAASTGGQFLPPVMGAGAFIMAEILGMPYIKICMAATIPAILYLSGVLAGIHLEALRVNLGRIPPEKMSNLRETLTFSRLASLFIPVVVLVYLLIDSYTPRFAAFWAVITAIVIFLFSPPWHSREIKQRPAMIWNGLISGAQNLVGIFCLILAVQVMVSLIGLTGIGVKLSSMVIMLGGGNFLGALAVSGLAAIVMGMGMPTTAAYVLGVTVLGGALIKLGLDPLVTHLFIFYYAIISVLTPPVCAAVYVASGIAESNWRKTAGIAMRLAMPAYLVPFAFVFNPALIGRGSLPFIVLATLTAVIGVVSLAAGTMGYFARETAILERILFIGASVLLIWPGFLTDGIGLVLLTLGWFVQKYIHGRIGIPFFLPKE